MFLTDVLTFLSHQPCTVTLRDYISISFHHLWALPSEDDTSGSWSAASRTTCSSWILLLLTHVVAGTAPRGEKKRPFVTH